MPIRVALIATALLAATASAHAAQRLEVGQSGVLHTTALACPTLDGMRAVLQTAKADFEAGVAKGAAEGCKSFGKGTEVFVVEVPNAVLACVRPKGEKACVWTAQDRFHATD
ncbi:MULTISPECIES: hypothetical protein [Bradyrhizobium]|uniref:hypothetical protein n=1 Tax=Bradyrhizobium TaxID=374 RepID=UPI0004AD4D6E|nr:MULTISPECIES: hypothetical protein [Bradyrhizobium]MBR0948490.1 hypothetical protein [Bradyrhizobium liaoningense]MBR1034592.1 hypothetical protein [Bradyrhizobium liaoningense]MDI2077899.1 hypothetical protein [Bradyrhizobium sp. Mp27]